MSDIKQQCAAMIKHKDDIFYHQCNNNATRFGFCGTHLSNWTPEPKTPYGVPHYTNLMPRRRLTFKLVAPSKMYQHAWWLKRDLEITAQKCIEWKNASVELYERLDREEAEAREANAWTCPKCNKKWFDVGKMHTLPITDKQRYAIETLLRVCVVTSLERATILTRLTSHDRAWAFKAVHELSKHRERVPSLQNWKTEAPF